MFRPDLHDAGKMGDDRTSEAPAWKTGATVGPAVTGEIELKEMGEASFP
jgi:hypothetical protein